MPLRNSVHRRNHKERSQLAHRSRLGILEKHKDYVLRARDYHSKQDRIKRLRQKAAERNKDEFYFSMNRERTKGGIHIQSRGNEALPIDMVKILKTQDENYVRTMRTSNQKVRWTNEAIERLSATLTQKIEKLKQQLTALADLINPGLLNEDEDLDEDDLEVLREAGIVARPANKKKSGKIPKHIIFSTEEEAPTEYSPEEKPLSGDPVDLGWKVEKKKGRKGKARETASSTTEAQTEIEDEQRRTEAEAHRKRLLKELSARLVRDKQLRYAQRELEMQRLLMGKGARRKLSGPQKIDDGNDEDDLDDPRTNRKLQSRTVDPKTYKPREYKWRIERSR